jgi:hypothetical protein
MKRLLTAALGLALGLAFLAGCGPSKKEEDVPVVKDLRKRGKPVDLKK